jgi:sugar phosphate isomerase/epimerase
VLTPVAWRTLLIELNLGEKNTVRGQGRDLKRDYGRLLARVQVNVPYRQLVDQYLELFLQYHVNPEIGFDADTLDRFNQKAMAEVAHLIRGRGRTITFHGPFMDLAPGGLDEHIRKVSALRLERTMELVPLFSAESVVFHAGYDERRYHAHRQQWLSGSLATWEPIVKRAEEIDVAIHLENVYEHTPEMILTLIETIASENLGFCLDVGHMNAFGDAPLQEWLDALGPYLKEVHLHDNDGQNDTHGAIGSGTAPIKELFQYLGAEARKPLVTLEPHEETSFWQSLETLEKLWPREDQCFA